MTIDFIEIITVGVGHLVFGETVTGTSKVLDFIIGLFSWQGGIGWFAGFSMSLIMLMIIIEGIKAGVDAIRGDGFKIDKKIVVLLMVIGILATYKPLAKEMFKATVSIGNEVSGGYKDLTKSVDSILERVRIERKAKAKMQKIKALNSIGVGGAIGGIMAGWHSMRSAIYTHVPSFVEAVTFFILMLIKILIAVKVAGAFVTFGIVLMVGPFFIPWFINDEFKSITTQWFSNIIVYFLEIQIMMMVLKLANYIAQYGLNTYIKNIKGFISWDNMFVMIVFPAFTVSIIFAVSRMTRTLFSSVIGGAEDSSPGMVGAAAGVGMKGVMMGFGMMKGAASKALYKSPNADRSRVTSAYKSMKKTRAEVKKSRRFGPKKGGGQT